MAKKIIQYKFNPDVDVKIMEHGDEFYAEYVDCVGWIYYSCKLGTVVRVRS